MKTTPKLWSALAVASVMTLAGCANTGYSPYPPNANVANSYHDYATYGVVQSIELVQQETTGSTVGVGTIAGAVIGGVLGNQVGAGRGKTVATVAGAAGGAYIGHELENRPQQRSDAYRITVRMEDGSYQALMQSSNGGFRVGDRVRFDNGVMQRY